MSAAIPPAYRSFRIGWTVLHVALVAALLLRAASWYKTDEQGNRAVAKVWSALGEVQAGFASILPFPWEKK